MELVKVTLDKKNIDISLLNINSTCASGLVEFEYKDILYTTDISEVDNDAKEDFLTSYDLLEKLPPNWSYTDWVNEQFEIKYSTYAEQILLEYPELWVLDEERMWNENNTLSLANNTIQFKKPFDLFAGLEEGSQIDIFTDGQNTVASPKDNPSLWIAEIDIDVKNYIECRPKGKAINQLNEFEFVAESFDTEVYFYFEGMTVVFGKEPVNPFPNNCSLCSDFINDNDLYCSGCTQIEE